MYKSPSDENCLLLGDFNILRSPRDGNKHGRNINKMLLFNDDISHLGLVGIPLKCSRFTWSNMQSAPLLQRLDWFFSSLAWTSNVPTKIALGLAMTTSNHDPCVISIETSIPESTVFRFENNWIYMEDFLPVMELTWTTPSTA
jgi:hypothetical protein